jgi:hypothetical protein
MTPDFEHTKLHDHNAQSHYHDMPCEKDPAAWQSRQKGRNVAWGGSFSTNFEHLYI